MDSPRASRRLVTLALALVLAAELHWLAYQLIEGRTAFLRFYGPQEDILNRLLVACLLASAAAWLGRHSTWTRRLEAAQVVPDSSAGLATRTLAVWALSAAVVTLLGHWAAGPLEAQILAAFAATLGASVTASGVAGARRLPAYG